MSANPAMSVPNATVADMLLGYARTYTAEQHPDHQTDARVSVDATRMYLDRASGAK